MNINFIVNENANLIYLVNCWSKWSIDVNESYYDYFAAGYDFTYEDKQQLQRFKDLRINKHIDWGEEAKLMEWATNNFPNNSKFDELRDIVKHFESIVIENATLLKDFIKDQVVFLENIKEKLSFEYKRLKADVLLEKLSLLNPTYRNLKDVKCYLVFAIEEGCGGAGANGGEMICEVLPNASQEVLKDTASVLIHEYLHIAVVIKKRLLNDEDTKEIFLKPFPNFEGRNLADLFDELFTYSTCNTLIDHKDSKSKVENYSKFDQQVYKEAVFYWAHVDEFGKIIKSYMGDRMSEEECYKTLIKQYLFYIPK